MITPLAGCLLVSCLLFAIGLAGALSRRNSILMLVGIELMLNAANLNLVAFWRFGPHAGSHPEALTGVIFVLFAIGIAAAEAAVGLALILAADRHSRTPLLGQLALQSDQRRRR